MGEVGEYYKTLVANIGGISGTLKANMSKIVGITISAAESCAWNPSDKASHISLSNGDMTATFDSSGYGIVLGTIAKNSGKKYFEMVCDVVTASKLGIATGSASLTNYLGSDAGGWCTDQRGYKYHSGSYTATDDGYIDDEVVQVAVDLDNGKVWFGASNTWIDSGNPAAGTNPAYTDADISSNDIYPAAGCYYQNEIYTLRCSSGDQTYSPPSGFTAWDD